jgi:hypothetical protein
MHWMSGFIDKINVNFLGEKILEINILVKLILLNKFIKSHMQLFKSQRLW